MKRTRPIALASLAAAALLTLGALALGDGRPGEATLSPDAARPIARPAQAEVAVRRDVEVAPPLPEPTAPVAEPIRPAAGVPERPRRESRPAAAVPEPPAGAEGDARVLLEWLVALSDADFLALAGSEAFDRHLQMCLFTLGSNSGQDGSPSATLEPLFRRLTWLQNRSIER